MLLKFTLNIIFNYEIFATASVILSRNWLINYRQQASVKPKRSTNNSLDVPTRILIPSQFTQ